MTEVLDPPVIDLPPIDAAMIDAPRTDVAVAAAAALDLKKLDLTAVALAQFGDWRAAVAKLKADNEKTVLVLPTQAKIDEAVSLRQRTIKAPLAEARKVETALKSKLAQVSKAVGAELAELIAGYEDAGTPLTRQIEAAQKLIDDEKEAKRQAEHVRLAGLRDLVDTILNKWVAHCKTDDMTAGRIADGIAALEGLAMPADVADVSVYWGTNKGTTLAEMRKLHGAALAREEAARLEAQRLENERIAAEQARVAAELAAQQRALAEQAAALARQAEEIEAARQRAITPAAPAATEGRADTPEPGKLEAAPITQEQDSQHVVKAEAARPDATDRDAPAFASPVGGPMGVGQPAAAGPVVAVAAPHGKHGCCADKACTDATCMELPIGKTCGDCVHCSRCTIMFGHTPSDTYCDWFPRRFHEKTEHAGPSNTPSEAAPQQADEPDYAALEADLNDGPIYSDTDAHKRVYTSPAAMIADIMADTDDNGADLLLDPGTAAAEAADEAAEFASWTAGPVQMVGFEGQLYDPELIDIIRWAYSKLHASEFTDMHDALMLDRMKLLLTGESL